MARYVDGFVLPVPKKNMAVYRRIGQKAGKIWRQHGALDYVECAGDDLKVSVGLPFPRGIRSKPGETAMFSFIVYKSRAKVMADRRIHALCAPKNTPFDCKRMLYGGFKAIVEA